MSSFLLFLSMLLKSKSMSFKYSLILFLGICCSVLGAITEEEQRKWLEDMSKEYWEDCKNKISDDSLQQLKDDIEADNEEIRDFRLCLSIYREYIKMSKINVTALLEDYKKYASEADDNEIKLAEKMLNICKDEGEEQTEDKDIVGKFSACVIDRCKSGL